MQANLSWPQARALADNGSVVRRAGWLSSSIFATAGGLYWFNAPDGSQRVITAVDFQRGEFLAMDWTDSAANQGHCVGIGITAEMVASPNILASSDPTSIILSISIALDADLVFNLSSSSPLLTPATTVTIPAGKTSATFSATAGSLSDSSTEEITATSNLCSCVVSIGMQSSPSVKSKKIYTFVGSSHEVVNVYGQTQAIGKLYFQNPWSDPCLVNISGSVYLQLFGGMVNGPLQFLSGIQTPGNAAWILINQVSSPVNVSFQLAAGAYYELVVYGYTNIANWNLNVILSL